MKKRRTENKEQGTKKRRTYADYLASLMPGEEPISEDEFDLVNALVDAHLALRMSVEVFSAIEAVLSADPRLGGIVKKLSKVRLHCITALERGTPEGTDPLTGKLIVLTKTA